MCVPFARFDLWKVLSARVGTTAASPVCHNCANWVAVLAQISRLKQETPDGVLRVSQFPWTHDGTCLCDPVTMLPLFLVIVKVLCWLWSLGFWGAALRATFA